MTDDFREKFEKAIEKGLLAAKCKNQEYLNKVESNRKYADLYMQLVLAFVEQYDFYSGSLNTELVDKELLSNFGYPKFIEASVSEENGVGTITFDYTDITGLMRECDSEFKRSDNFDLEIVNDLLKENGINVREEHLDGRGLRERDHVFFDASMLVKARREILDTYLKHERKR